MTTLKQLKCIGKRYKYSVFGYIRLKEKELSLCNIPQMIHYLCLQYYFHGEYFDKCIGDDAEISSDKMITKAMSTVHYFYDAVYGKLSIDSLSNCIATWTFKLVQLDTDTDGYGIRIFLLSDELKKNNCSMSHYYFYNNGNSYARPKWPIISEESMSEKPPKFATGDIIKLILDTKNAMIALRKNEDDFEYVIFQNIHKGANIKYKVAICLLEKNNAIEIIDFDCNQ